MFLTRREPGVPLSLFRPYPLPFSPPFLLYCSLPFLFFYVLFIDLYLLQFPGRHSICCFPHCSHMFLTRREPGVPLSLFRFCPLPFYPPFLLYCSLPFLFFYVYVFFIDLYLLLFPGRHSICCFPHCSHMFLTRRDLECPCLFSDLILFPFLLLFFYIVPYPSFSSMSFSLTYICCSFRGGILSAVFPTVAICFWPAGNLECPCLFSDLILFPFLLLFFYIVPYPSFSSMSFSLIYICCSLILFPFLLLFFYIVPYPSFSSMSFSLIYICCSFRGGILSVVFPLYPYVSDPQGTWSALVSFPILSSSLFSSFSSILFLTLPFLLCLFHWSISAVASGEAFYLLFSPL